MPNQYWALEPLFLSTTFHGNIIVAADIRTDDDKDNEQSQNHQRYHSHRIFLKPSPGILPVGDGRTVDPVGFSWEKPMTLNFSGVNCAILLSSYFPLPGIPIRGSTST